MDGAEALRLVAWHPGRQTSMHAQGSRRAWRSPHWLGGGAVHGVSTERAAFSMDFGGSSKYSKEDLED